MNMNETIEKKLLAAVSQDLVHRFEELQLHGITGNDFTNPLLQKIYKAMETSLKMNVNVLTAEVMIQSGINPAETTSILQDFDADLPSFPYYLQQLLVTKQDRVRENIMKTYGEKIKKTVDVNEKTTLSGEMMERIAAVDLMYVGKDEKDLAEIVDDMYTEEAIQGKPLETGFEWLDKYTMGVWRGLPHILAGESGNGKSTMMRNLAVRMALPREAGGKGYKVLVISHEMIKELLAQQFLAMLNNDFMKNWYNFNIAPENMDAKRHEASLLANAIPNLHIDDSSYTAEKLARKIRSSKGVYDLIIFDYFQSLDLADNQNEGQAYNRASKIITRAVKETKDVALILLSQVTADEGKKAKTAKQHQEAKLRYSKQLLNDAAWELIVYRDDTNETETENEDETPDFSNSANKINLFIRKNRNGEQNVLESFPFFDSKGVIGQWKAVKGVEKDAPKRTKDDYLFHGWSTGNRPTHTYEEEPIMHLNGPELVAIGFHIPHTMFTPDELAEGVRDEMVARHPNLFAAYMATRETEEQHAVLTEDLKQHEQETISFDPFEGEVIEFDEDELPF